MIDSLDYSIHDLIERASALGNHHQKHIFNVEKNFDTIVSFIDKNGLIDQFRLNRFSPHPSKEMKLIVTYIEDREIQLEMLGCYFSLQFLLMNIKALDVLKMDLFESTNSYNVFRSFVIQSGNDFRLLSGAYMTTLLNIFLPKENRPEFVVCGVGTRVDQDDIDLGVIDTGVKDREILNAAFGALNTEMLKYVCPLHFHLSEHVGNKRGYSASVEEYHRLLDDQFQDVVILSEMLNSVPILGHLSLYNRFKREILERYYYHEGKDNKYHEGFLRGLLGEIRDLMTKELPDEILNPKRDALRMLKAVLFAIRTSKGIKGRTSLEVLGNLMNKDHTNTENYNWIYQALTFFETFRFLYMLYVVQEEDIFLEDEMIRKNLQKIALTMGYEDKTYASALTQLLIHYRDHQKLARLGAENLIREVTHHLGNITVFYPITHFKQTGGYDGNVAVDFIKMSKFFRGTRFWDDITNWLDRNDEILLNRFLNDFMILPENKRKTLIRLYVKWGSSSPYPVIAMITIIVRRRPQLAYTEFISNFIELFIRELSDTLDTISRLSQIVNFAPRTINDFLSGLSDDQMEKFIRIIDRPTWQPEIEKPKETLLSLCRLYQRSSYYFKRFIHRVFTNYSQHISFLNHKSRISEFAEGLFRNLDNFETLCEKIDKLGDYYDFEFMRLGIDLINGIPFEQINREFTQFSDNYIKMLFEFCREEVSEEIKHNVPETKDLLAIFIAGGHGRSQAFDDDYDLIILLNSEDKNILEFSNRIILKMNKRIIQRSIMPHYRFSDRFRNYVTTFQNLHDFFNRPDENAFIDKSQLLGSRMIVGSEHFRTTYIRDIIRLYIFNEKLSFIQALRAEINASHPEKNAQQINIKEASGGLRDTENFLFILKTKFEISDPISSELIDQLSAHLPDQSVTLGELFADYLFLKHVRDLYRLMASNDDHLQSQYLNIIVQPLCASRNCIFKTSGDLERCIRQTLRRNSDRIANVLSHLNSMHE